MAYKSYFVKTNTVVPTRSRAGAGTYGGLQCPDKVSFSFVHGPQPGSGEVEFEGDVDAFRAGQEIYLNIGQNTFYGIVVKKERSVRVDSGYSVKYFLADNRDRLLDDLVFGQFNMVTQDGDLFHVFPIHWEQQKQTIIRAVDKSDFTKLIRDPAKVRRANIDIAGCTKPFTSAELLDFLAGYFNFAWDASPVALKMLKAARPWNMDWNGGTPVGQAIQDVLNFSELQFTVYGNLLIFITVTGYTENTIQWELLKSNEALCNIGSGFSQTNLGQELNSKGRRLILTGSPNKYQFIYPGLPGWNVNWNWFTINSYEIAFILQTAGLTASHKVKDMPKEFHDYGTWHGSSRMEMTIYDYMTQIPFKVYIINMNVILDDDHKVPHLDPQEINKRFQFTGEKKIKFIPKAQRALYAWQLPMVDPRIDHVNPEYFSRYPVSDSLITHSGNLAFNPDPDHTITSRQFIAWANSHIVMRKDQVDPWDMIQQTVRIDDGVSLEIEEIVHAKLCRKMLKVYAVFAAQRFYLLKKPQFYLGGGKFGHIDPNLPERYQDKFPYKIEPDRPYFAISTDREIFNQAFGEPSKRGQRVRYRQREKVVNVTSLRRGFVNDDQVFMLMANMNTRVDELGRIVKDINGNPIQSFSAYTADEIAPAIAAQVLRHEAVTSAGSITFEDAAAFKPDGLIASVVDEWNVEIGIQETVNFTNDQNHEFRQVVIDTKAIQKGAPDSEQEATRRELIRRAKEIIKNPQPQRAPPLPSDHNLGENDRNSTINRIQSPGSGATVVAEYVFNEDSPELISSEMVVLESTV